MVKIPAWARQHTAIFRKRTSTDTWDGPEYAADVTLSGIRVEPTSRIVLSKDNQQVQLASLLFYDCQGSSPAGITFAELDQVEFKGRKFTVVSVDEPYEKSDLHHYEVGLI